MEDNDYGKKSEWNEGDLKNLRLHEAQELINIGKIDPFSISERGDKLNCFEWKGGIDILFGEGVSKYAPTECEDVKKIKNLVEAILDLKPPFKSVVENGLEKQRVKFIPLKENQAKIVEVLEVYEQLVKKLNDDHGLSTRNVDVDDVMGL